MVFSVLYFRWPIHSSVVQLDRFQLKDQHRALNVQEMDSMAPTMSTKTLVTLVQLHLSKSTATRVKVVPMGCFIILVDVLSVPR